MSEALLLCIALIDSAILLFLSVYFIITLSDLECDFLNSSTCCAKLNRWVLPEVIAACFCPLVTIFAGHWILFIVNLPFPIYLVNRYLKVSAGNIGVFDPTEIHNRGLLKGHMKETMVKLGYYVVFFFIYLYSFVYVLVSGGSSS
uniref:Protein cornichon homolog 4 n=1 Tax=Ciona intestinalis TaxID=7719 RepID=F6TIT1_CIOIN|nr:protein cornichon homolog 4 [Ciona intestinalis]|eukprot:XP_009860124.1 protein cornichon homolog 4 [Ciona intestinalis]